MAATVTGTFVLLDRATGPLRRIEQQAQRTDRALGMAGDKLDSIGTRSQMAKHEELGRKLRETENNADLLNKRLGKTVGATDAVAAAAGRASVGMRGFGGAIGLVAVGLAALLPVVSDLAGGLGALIGSLGRALKGAAALSVGGIGVLTVAIGGLAGTIIPAVSNLGKLSEAFNAVSEAQQKYGKGSKEARQAMKEMAQARKSMENFDVKRGMAVITGFDTIKGEWSKMTAKGQSAVLQMLLDTMNTTRSLMPMLARNANEIASATGVMMRTFLERLDGPEFRRFVDAMTDTYELVAKPLAEAFANIGEALGNIAVAATDELERLAFVLRDATRGWLDSTSAVGEMKVMIGETSREMGDWYDLLVASWDWLVAIFGPGANQGQGLVKSMTDKLNEQTEWFRTNPATMMDFYKQSTDGVRGLARFLGDIAPTLWDISEAMRPVVDAFESLVNLLSEIQIGNINALTLAITGFGIGKLGSLVQGLGGMMSGGMMSGGMGRGRGGGGGGGMASPAGGLSEAILMRADNRFGVAQSVYIEALSPMAASQMARGGAMFSPGMAPVPTPNQYPAPIGPATRSGGMSSRVMAGGGFAAGLGMGARQGAAGMFGGTRAAIGALRNARGAGGVANLLGSGIGRLGVGALRLGGRAFAPLAALFAIGDFLSTEGNFGDKLQGAASGFTFGAIPKPLTDAEMKQEAMKPLFDKEGPLQLDPRSGLAVAGTTRADFAAQRQEILAPFAEKMEDIRATRQRNAGSQRSLPPELRQKPLPIPTAMEMAQKDPKAKQQIRAVALAEGRFAGDSIAKGMAIRLRDGKTKRAVSQATREVFAEIGRAQTPEQAREASRAALLTAKAVAKENPKLKGAYERMARGVEKRLDGMGENVAVVNGKIVRGTAKRWQEIKDNITNPAERAAQETQDSFTEIQNQALGVLSNMGYSRAEARKIISRADGSGKAPNTNERVYERRYQNAMGGRLEAFAGGGRLKGQGKRDTVPLTLGMAAPGELVVNRHTEGRVDSLLNRFGTSLDKEVKRERVPHSGTPTKANAHERIGDGPSRRGRRGGGGGGGGGVGLVRGSYPMVTGDTDFSAQMGQALSQMARATGTAIYVQSGGRSYAEQAYLYATKGPGLAAPPGSSKHETGMAADITPGREVFGSAAGRFGLGFTVPHESWHIELTDAGAVGGFVGGPATRPQRINLKAPRTKQRGLPGAAAQRGMDMMTVGLERSINKQLRGRGGGGRGGTVTGKATYFGGGMMASGLNTDVNPGIALNPNPGGPDNSSWSNPTTRGWLENRQRFLVTVGGKSAVLPVLDLGPAGWTGNAIDVNMAGLAKMGYTPATFPSGTVGTARALAKGGRIPFGGWYGNGGRFVTNGPTLIGVGEKGKETVQVTPAGKSAGAGGGIKIGNINIQNHRKGDIKRQVKEEISAAFAELEREVSGDTDGGVV